MAVTVAITSVTDPITAGNVATVVAAGTTDVGTNTVTVTFVDASNVTVGPIVATVVTTNWSIAPTDLTALADGLIVCTATATDLAAAQAFDAVATTKPAPATVPTVSVSTATDPVNTLNETAFAVTGVTAPDTNTVAVLVSDETDVMVGPFSATVVAGGAWTVAGVNVSGLDDGALIVMATATDLSGDIAFDAKTTHKLTTAPAYATVAQVRAYMKDPSVTIDQTLLEACALAASRRVDGYCGRHFYQHTEPQHFSPEYGSPYVLCLGDMDLATTADLVVEVEWANAGNYSETYVFGTDFIAEPIDQSYGGIEGWPFLSLRSLGGKIWPPRAADYYRDTVRVTGTWGWPAIPEPVHQATLIIATELYALGNAPYGIAGFDGFGPVRVRDNPIAKMLLDPYRKGSTLLLA